MSMSQIKKSVQLSFKPNIKEHKGYIYFNIDQDIDENMTHSLNIQDIQEFLKQNQFDTYEIYGLEFAFNLNQVTSTLISNMFDLINQYNETIQEIVIKMPNQLDENFNIQNIPILFSIDQPISLCLDWREKSIINISKNMIQNTINPNNNQRLNQRNLTKKKNYNSKMIQFLTLFKQICSDIKYLNIQFAKAKSEIVNIKEVIQFIVNLEQLEDLKINFNHYINHDAFQPLILIEKNDQLKRKLKKVDFNFNHVSLSSQGSAYISQFLKNCYLLESVKLCLRHNRLQDSDLITILKSIENKEFISSLHLSLSNNCLKQGTEYISQFINQFASQNKLKSFILKLKQFEFKTEQMSLNLFNIFNQLASLTHLTLNLKMANIINSQACLERLSQSIGQMQQLKQLSIDLSETKINQEACQLLNKIGNLDQLISLKLGLSGISYSEIIMKTLEQSIQKLKSLEKLTLNMSFANQNIRNLNIYEDIINIIEQELTELKFLEITEINEISKKEKNSVKMDQRIQQKILLRKQLAYAVLCLPKLYWNKLLKRKEIILDFYEFFMISNYFK